MSICPSISSPPSTLKAEETGKLKNPTASLFRAKKRASEPKAMAISGVEVKAAFVGAGCNRVVNNVSFGASDLVSFGAQNAVAIFCPKSAQILTTLPGHKALVNCTQWIPSAKFAFKAKHLQRHYLLSGDADGVIILWELSVLEGKWRLVLQLPESHRKGVTCITAIMVSETKALFASSSSDNSVFVWELAISSSNGGDCNLVHLESLSIGSKPMVALSLAELPGSDGCIVLAMGGLDNKIHLYSGERRGKFVHACELKGHTDWIRCLDFSLPVHSNTNESTETILLVSSSQDKGIRIWKFSKRGKSQEDEMSLASYIKGPVLNSGLRSYQISLESLLIGHEDWVYSVQWQPPYDVSGENYQPQSILSASMDKTMMIWQPELTSGIWVNVVSVGELSHCALGFYGCHWSSNGDSILAHGYGGSFHLWKNVGLEIDNWQPQKVPSGHFAGVSDISWARSGQYFLSVSHDQTARIFAPWKNETSCSDIDSWHEIARPQVHGHDMNCVAMIRGKGNHRYVSGADEKVARVFEAPLSFLKTLNALSKDGIGEDIQTGVQVLGANMSALGLSQKPIYVHSEQGNSDKTVNNNVDPLETIPEAVPVALTEPPIEDQLAWHTLWPESHKLYGHGNELFSLCCNHQGNLVASSCKAQSTGVAEIWVWEVGSWKAVGRMKSHSLTVTHMQFSVDDNLLLTVSRDRHLSVFAIEGTGTDQISHKLVARQEAHKRIIWACSWNPCGHEFATGSRDKTVKIWAVENRSSVKLLLTLPSFKTSVTALSWVALGNDRNDGLLAVGMESGLIEIWSVSINRTSDGVLEMSGTSATLLSKYDAFMCHVSSVNRLAWSPETSEFLRLVSCGADHCVRVYDVTVN